MKIADNNGILEYNKLLDEKMRKQSAMKEAEIEKVRKFYDQKIEDAKEEGEARYASGLQRNDDQLLAAAKANEERLNGIKEGLERTQKSISQQESSLKSEHEQKMDDLRMSQVNNLHDQYANASEIQEAVRSQIKQEAQTIADKTRAERKHIETNARTEVNALADSYDQKGISEERDFRSRLENDLRAHEEQIKSQRSDLKKVIDTTTEQNNRLKAEKVQVQKEELSYLDNHQKDVLAQKNADFKVRYENMAREHERILSELKTHLDRDVKKMVEQTSSQKKIIEDRAQDSFYRVETLSPMITETPKDFTVSLRVPEHEKEKVHLSVHNRDVKMTLARKFTDILDDQDGSTNRSTRSELFSKEFSSKDILNPKEIVQKYENGVLTFRIQKL
ncbi:MAG: Hsp20 family protein [Bacteriovorax sp.]